MGSCIPHGEERKYWSEANTAPVSLDLASQPRDSYLPAAMGLFQKFLRHYGMPISDGLLALFQLAYDNTTREGEMVTRSGR